MNLDERNKLAIENLPLVGYLVSDACRRAPHLSRDDLAAAGALALVTCARSFDPDQGVKFGTYARRRILGAFADQMRSDDWASRSTRRKIRTAKAVAEVLTGELGRNPTDSEMAAALGMSPETVREIMADSSRIVSELDDVVVGSLRANVVTPDESVLAQEQARYLRAAVEALPQKMRRIVEQIYFEDRTVAEVAAEFGTTHSAVSQQRAEAIRLLRDGMAHHYSEDSIQSVPESRISPARRSAYLASMAALTAARGAAGVLRTVAAATA